MDSGRGAQLSMAVFEDMIVAKHFAHASEQQDPYVKMIREMKDMTVEKESEQHDWIDLTEKLDQSP